MADGKHTHNYLVIMGYMIEDMGLSGNQAMAYALIYGFCQAGRECDCSLRYFQFWLGCSKSTAIRVIDSLVERGFVVRNRRTVNGVPFTSYSLGPNAFDYIPSKPLVGEKPQVDQWCQFDTTGVAPQPPETGRQDSPSSGGSVNLTLPVSKLDPITDTDTDSESESVSASGSKEGLQAEGECDAQASFAALKAYLPNTDGAAFGFANYRRLLDAGHSPQSIRQAMAQLAASLRADYPGRAARYFPHAEKLLDPHNPNGVMRFLDPGKAAARREPTDRELLIFALAQGPREMTIAVDRLNAAISRAQGQEERRAALAERQRWLEENREALLDSMEKARMSKARR